SNIIGKHDGAIYYTTGQRHGLGIGGGQPYFVTGKDIDKNEVYVSTNEVATSLSSAAFRLTDPHWLGSEPEFKQTYSVRIRHRGHLIPCEITHEEGRITVAMKSAERAITSGQSAVIYDGKKVVGGGIISVI
ncbi:MAG: aminomethyltransferase beta-barrel domain-containing protein, partial [Candidatus Saccharibacteria bacterium]